MTPTYPAGLYRLRLLFLSNQENSILKKGLSYEQPGKNQDPYMDPGFFLQKGHAPFCAKDSKDLYALCYRGKVAIIKNWLVIKASGCAV